MPSSLQRTLPNLLSISRMVAAPIIVAMMWMTPPPNTMATSVFLLAAWTDFLDGDLARRWKVVSPAGVFFDLTSDKIFVSAILIALIPYNLIAVWMVIAIVSREFLVSGLRAFAAAKGVVIPASPWGKSKTVLTLIALAATLMRLNDTLDNLLLLAATILTILSAIDYLQKGWRASFRGS